MISAILILGLGLASAEPDRAATDRAATELAGAIESYEFGEHAAAAEQLEALLSPIRLEEIEDVILARQYLGACYFVLGNKDKAESEFAKILALDAEHRLDPQVFSPAIVVFFEDVRSRTGLNLRKAAPEPLPREATTTSPAPEATPKPASAPPLGLAFVPFGVGQFNNRSWGLGSVFAVVETGLVATSIATYVSFQNLCVTGADGQCRVQAADESKAETLQTVALATFWSAVGVIAIGVVEALISYPGRGRAPDELDALRPPPALLPAPSRLATVSPYVPPLSLRF